MDYKRSILLLLFYNKPRSKYEIALSMEKTPKSVRIPQASLYRIAKELEDLGYIKATATPRHQTTRPDETVNEYQLTLKGNLAARIYTYILLLDPKTPSSLMEKLKPEELIKRLEAGPDWALFINFLRWHRERRDDLSRVKLGAAEYYFTLLLSVLQEPESLTDSAVNSMLEQSKQLGLNLPQSEPSQVRKLLEDLNKAMQALEERILAVSKEAKK